MRIFLLDHRNYYHTSSCKLSDSSINESQNGDGCPPPCELLVYYHFSKCHTLGRQLRKNGGSSRKLCHLAHRLKEMSFGGNRTSPPSGPVKTPGPIASQAMRQQVRRRATAPMAVDRPGDNDDDDQAEAGNPGGNCAPPPPAAPPTNQPNGGGTSAAGGDEGDPNNDGDDDSDDKEDEDTDDSSAGSTESKAQSEDPENAGTGKFYMAQTPNGKAMVKMFKRFCDPPDQDASAIVVYFGVYSEGCLAEFLHDHWKDNFTQWQKHHPNRDGTERAMVFSPPQQD